MKKLLFLFLSVLIVSCNNKQVNFSSLENGFQNPDDSLNPWCYYYWVADNVTREGITKDLESMAEKGISTAFIGNIGTVEQFQGDVDMLSDEWFDLTVHAIKEAQRVGVDLGMFNSPGWSMSGGPWNKAENSMRYMVYSETETRGPRNFNDFLQKPRHNLDHSYHYNLDVQSAEDTTYEDIRVLAFPAPQKDNDLILDYSPTIEADNLKHADKMLDSDRTTASFFNNSEQVIIEIETEMPFTARSLRIWPYPEPFNMDFELYAKENGSFKKLKSFNLNRSNAMISVGFIPFAPGCVTFPEVTSKHFRLVTSNIKTPDAGIAEVELSGAALVEHYKEKLLAKMFQSPLPLWDSYKWEGQFEPADNALFIDGNEVLDISGQMSSEGKLNWKVPEGDWIIMRIGAYPTGTKNTPASKESTGLEVDKMNEKHVRHHFNSYLKKFIDTLPADQRKSFKYVIADSYEQGSQNWTDDLNVDFMEKYGYDPVPFLPVLSGRIVGNADQSNRFLWDLRRIVADKIAYEYVGGLKKISNEYGLKVWLENYGHWGFPAEFLQYGGQSDMVGGEFWADGNLGSIECKAASSAVHIYNKDKTYAESYTSSGKPFERHPAILKKRGDFSYAQGINHTVLTLFIHQPYQDKYPGIMEWYGSEINRFNTWFSQADTWIEYLKRCHFMLQQGEYVADVCYFIGEDVPVMTGTRNPELPEGYSYDYINAEGIMMATAENGKITLPGGMTYNLLVLPQMETITPELLEKISDLVDNGVTVLGPPPKRSPSLKNYPECDKDVQSIAASMWKADQRVSSFGKGKVYTEMNLKEVLNDMQIPEDLLSGNKNILWTHRQTGGSEIYFIANQSDEEIKINPGFRVTSKQPELWDATDGRLRRLPEFEIKDSHTFIPVELHPGESAFLVFRDKIKKTEGQNYPEPVKTIPLNSEWTVKFDTEMRGPEEEVIFSKLTDWKDHTDEKIKYYSGTAVYTTEFDLESLPEDNLILNLGNVGVMAKVKINGNKAGGVWTPPYSINISDVVKEGTNTLEIEVVNLWINRLIKDRGLPEDERLTWLSLGHEVIEEDKPLFPSGLLGPVNLEFINY